MNGISQGDHVGCGTAETLPASVLLHHRCIQQRVPVGGSFDLTHRCNLRCQHCYLGDQIAINRHRDEELSTAEVFDILNQAADAGTLFLTMAGGDPMVRSDFAEIYRHAVRKGMLVTVFSNGTLINEAAVELFRALPPRQVEVSVYGATAETYEHVTQVKGSFERFVAGIDLLRRYGVRFRLKTVVMTLNVHELEGMEAMAARYGAGFRYDSAIFPCLPHTDNQGGSNRIGRKAKRGGAGSLLDPIDLRIGASATATMDLATAKRRQLWLTAYHHEKGKTRSNRLYSCGAGIINFHIDPYGSLQPCVMTWSVRHNLRQGSFLQGWNGVIATLRDRAASETYHCNRCESRPVCLGCPSLFLLETGSEQVMSPYICETAQARFRKIIELEGHAPVWRDQTRQNVAAIQNT